MYARTKEWDLGDVNVAVDYDNRSTPRRFRVAIEVTGDLSGEQLERLEKVARVVSRAPSNRGRHRVSGDDRDRLSAPEHDLVETGRAS